MKLEEFKTKAEIIDKIKSERGCTAAEAEKHLRAIMPSESHYQKRCMDAIRKAIPSAFVWKAAAGPYGRAGIPDICAVIHGKFYGFEVKRPFFGVLSAIQRKTIEEIRQAGGKVFVVSCPTEVREILKEEAE